MSEAIDVPSAGVGWAGRERVRLYRHSDLFALAIVALGFGLRILSAQGRPLSGDEAIHFLLVRLPRALDADRESLNGAHPPLFFLLLHYWTRLGNSEFFLRLLPVALGSILSLGRLSVDRDPDDQSAALGTLVLLSFSPALVSLSAEVRPYALMLLPMSAALLLLEHALDDRSPRRMTASSVFLSLAILTHYSAFFVVPAFSPMGSFA